MTAAIVRQSADRAVELITASGGADAEPIAGYLAPTQERALLDQVEFQPGRFWIGDRNFCLRSLLRKIQDAGSCSLIRWHRTSCPHVAVEPFQAVGRCRSGAVFEQAVEWQDPADPTIPSSVAADRAGVERTDPQRRVGNRVMSDLSATVSAVIGCQANRHRWRIEGHFQTLTDLLHCEILTLSQPRAALFALAMSAVAGNALAVLKGNLRAMHEAVMVAELSTHAVVKEIAEVYLGIMIAVPREEWPSLNTFAAASLAEWLNDLAGGVELDRKLRQRRGPKPATKAQKSSGSREHHFSTKRKLAEAPGGRLASKAEPNPTKATNQMIGTPSRSKGWLHTPSKSHKRP